jgi:hypothetical protein
MERACQTGSAEPRTWIIACAATKKHKKGLQRSTKATTAIDLVAVALLRSHSLCFWCFSVAKIFVFMAKLLALTLFLRAPYSGRSLFEGT